LSGDRAGSTALATITITPTSKTVQDTYLMQGVTSNADADKLQVTVRQLNSTKTNTKQVTTTERFHQGERSASGNITFFNSSHNETFEVPAGTTFEVDSMEIITDETAVVPVATKSDMVFQYFLQDGIAVVPVAMPPTWRPGQTTVPAHAVQGGPAGNIAPLAINEPCCGSTSITAQNLDAFTGGTDAQDYNVLGPEGINKIINDNQERLKNDARQDIEKQIRDGEQLLGGITCDSPKTTQDAQPGTPLAAKNITSVSVTVSITCHTNVYDANVIQRIALNTLKRKADKDLGPGYVLADNIVTQTEPQIEQDNTPTFEVKARGLWQYRWGNANKQALCNLIKGMSKAQAQTILNGYPGVTNARIDVRNGENTLPTDISQIKLDVLPALQPRSWARS
jgi:hypothetical protein